jgi:FkbM family methyltransferase
MKIHDWILKNISKNAIILEAGTCEGIDTLFFSDNFPDGKIYGFEPVIDLFEKAKERVGNRKNVDIFNLALSDTLGKKIINVSNRFNEIWGSSSLLPPKDHLTNHPDITFNSQKEVQSITLEKFISDNSIEKIDLMWLDMQGYEPIVLMNSPNALKITKYIYTEVSTMENYEGMILYPEYKRFLESSGYEVIYEGLEWSDGGNVLFENKKISS